MTITNKNKISVQKVMAQAYKEFSDGKGMLLVMLEPADVKGVAFLIMERQNEADTMFTYLPSIRRTKKIVGLVDRYESFLGTDYTYSDLGFIDLKGDYRILEEEKFENTNAYKIEKKISLKLMPYYSKIITWVAKDFMLPLKREYYAPSGELWKVELFEDITVIDGVPTAMRRTIKDIMLGTSTELDLQELQYYGILDDKLFDPGNLPNVSSDPIFKPYCTLPGATE